MGMYRLELREGKALMGSSVGADEGQGGRLGGAGWALKGGREGIPQRNRRKAEELDFEGFRNPN